MMIEQVQEQLSVTKGKNQMSSDNTTHGLIETYLFSDISTLVNNFLENWWMVRNSAWKPIINCEFSSKSRQAGKQDDLFPKHISRASNLAEAPSMLL